MQPRDKPPQTLTSTDALAERADSLQYDLREGTCYAAVTDERFVLVNDLADSADYPRYGPKAVDLGVAAQAAVQLLHDGDRAGLNLYAGTAGAFDRSTVHFAELFASHAAAVLGYEKQVEQLSEALHTRTDFDIALGNLMERYGIDRNQAFAFLAGNSQNRNIKVRDLARTVIEGIFESTQHEDREARQSP